MERKLGERFEYEGKIYTAVKADSGTSCDGCALIISERPYCKINDVFGACDRMARKDKTHVVFKKVIDYTTPSANIANHKEVTEECDNKEPMSVSEMRKEFVDACGEEEVSRMEEEVREQYNKALNDAALVGIKHHKEVTEPKLFNLREQHTKEEWEEWRKNIKAEMASDEVPFPDGLNPYEITEKADVPLPEVETIYEPLERAVGGWACFENQTYIAEEFPKGSKEMSCLKCDLLIANQCNIPNKKYDMKNCNYVAGQCMADKRSDGKNIIFKRRNPKVELIPPYTLNAELLDKLDEIGLLPNDVRRDNVGRSNYSQHIIQPWSIILDWGLDFFEGNILKYLLRTKKDTPREEDMDKIIHYAQEIKRQLKHKKEC